jgi:hypothetical protein
MDGVLIARYLEGTQETLNMPKKQRFRKPNQMNGDGNDG